MCYIISTITNKENLNMPYNAAVAKKAYYKLPATTIQQLEKNLVRAAANSNLHTYALQAVIKNQFKMFLAQQNK